MQISDKDENYCPNLIFGAAVWTINRGEDLAEWKIGTTFVPGRMAEWSIAAVLKTVELQGSGGSNPSPSAKQENRVANLICNPVFPAGWIGPEPGDRDGGRDLPGCRKTFVGV